jgi:hypothetical protein
VKYGSGENVIDVKLISSIHKRKEQRQQAEQVTGTVFHVSEFFNFFIGEREALSANTHLTLKRFIRELSAGATDDFPECSEQNVETAAPDARFYQ